MKSLLRRFIFVMLIALLAACAQQPVPTLIPTPVPPTATATLPPTEIPTSTPVPEPTKNIPRTEAANPAEQAYLRTIHAAPGVDALDVYVEELNFAGGIEYGQVSDRSGIVAGAYMLSVVPTGGRLDGALARAVLTIAGQQTQILVVSGTRDALTLTFLTEDLAPMEGTKTRLSAFNAIPGSPAFTLIKEDSTPLTPALGFGGLSPVTTLDAGFYTFRAQSGANTLLTLPIELDGRDVYTFVITGDINNPSGIEALIVETQVEGLTTVRAIQAAQGIDPVDIYAGDILLGSSLGTGSDTTPLTVTSQSYDIVVYPAGADPTTTPALLTATWFANPDERVSIILAGSSAGLRFLFIAEDTRPTTQDTARIRFVNTMPSVRVELSSEGASGLQLNYGEISDVYEIPARPTSFTWMKASGTDQGTLLEFADNVSIEPGNTYLYLFGGRGTAAPLLYATFAGIEVAQEDLPQQTVATLPPPTRLRLVNGVPGTFVEFRLNDAAITQNLPYAGEKPPQTLPEGEHVLSAHTDRGELMAREIINVEPGKTYSAFLTGGGSTGYFLFVVADEIETGSNFPYARLINASVEDAIFGAGHAATTPASVAFSSAADGSDRMSIPFGVREFIGATGNRSVSKNAAITGATGPRDYYILAARSGQVSAIIPNMTLESGKFYDIVVYQQQNTLAVVAFIVPYTP